MKRKTIREKLQEINDKVANWTSIEELKKLRRKLYRISDYDCRWAEGEIQMRAILILCINEILEEEREKANNENI